MIVEMSRLRNEIESRVVEDVIARDLEQIFAAAESGLAQQQVLFRSLDVDNTGRIRRSTKNIAQAEKIADTFNTQINHWIRGPGRRWADRVAPVMQSAGRDLARTNLDVDNISQDLIDEIFAHIPRSERAVLRVGKTSLYTITGTVGDDVQTWFRNEMLDSIATGIPVQGPGSLAQRLFESGRLKPIVVRTEKGRLIRRSLRQRANAIARVESAKVINSVHDTLGERALGADRVAVNSNPQDSRTTSICSDASRQPAMSKEDWIASHFGLPPRLTGPFHWCRSVMIWGAPDWFDDEDAPKRKAPPKKAPPKRAPAKKPKGPSLADAAEKARMAQIALAKNVDAPVQDRIQAYGRTTGNAKIDQIKALAKHPPATSLQAVKNEVVEISRRLDDYGEDLDRLYAEDSRINSTGAGTRFEGQDLRKVYPAIGNRERAVPRLREIRDEMDAIADEMDLLAARRAELYEKGTAADAVTTTTSTPELRAQVMQIMRTEGDGIGKSSVPAPRAPKAGAAPFGSGSPAVYAKRLEASAAAEEGRDWVSGLLDPNATTTGVAHDVDVKWLGGSRAFARQGRRQYPGGTFGKVTTDFPDMDAYMAARREWLESAPQGAHSVHLPRDHSDSIGIEGRSTSVHEYGHTVEYSTGAGQMSADFFKYRAGVGAEMKTMKSWGFDWYKDAQRTNPDRFQDVMDSWAPNNRASEFAHYTGKQYGHGTTEIMSMGMEAFYRDPIGFVTRDPEWANYLFGVLDGGFKPVVAVARSTAGGATAGGTTAGAAFAANTTLTGERAHTVVAAVRRGIVKREAKQAPFAGAEDDET
jgi:hypothetical protein